MSKDKSSYGGGYSQKDARRDTDATRSQSKKAWHDARDHAAEHGGYRVPEHRHGIDKETLRKIGISIK